MLLRLRAMSWAALSSVGVALASLPLTATVAEAQGTETTVGTPPQRLADAGANVTPASQDPLIVQVDEAIRLNGQRYLTANYHSPWQIFHGMLAYRQDFLLKVGEQKMSAIEWIATADPRFDNLPLFDVSAEGVKFHTYTRPYAFEGHPSQTLALLSESRLPVDFKFRASGRDVTISDLLQSSLRDVNTREETTWVLWALINYYDVDTQWTNRYGQAWNMEALVRNEVAAHTPTRPCGGNHNLFALSRARDKYVATGRPLRGVWLEADQKIRQYVEYARSMQNADGSFSSNFYKGPGYSADMNTRFNTTGHTMEFLSVGLPDNRLNEPWVRKAVDVLSKELIVHRRASVDCGPLYHSLNALKIYRDRVQPPQPQELAAVTPEVPKVEVTEAGRPAGVSATPLPVEASALKPEPTTTAATASETSTAVVTPMKGAMPKSAILDAAAPHLPANLTPARTSRSEDPASALSPLNSR